MNESHARQHQSEAQQILDEEKRVKQISEDEKYARQIHQKWNETPNKIDNHDLPLEDAEEQFNELLSSAGDPFNIQQDEPNNDEVFGKTGEEEKAPKDNLNEQKDVNSHPLSEKSSQVQPGETSKTSRSDQCNTDEPELDMVDEKPFDFSGFKLKPHGNYNRCPDGEYSPPSSHCKPAREEQETSSKEKSVEVAIEAQPLHNDDLKYTEAEYQKVCQELKELQQLNQDLTKKTLQIESNQELLEKLEQKDKELESMRKELKDKDNKIENQQYEIDRLLEELKNRDGLPPKGQPHGGSGYQEQRGANFHEQRDIERENFQLNYLSIEEFKEMLLMHLKLLEQ